MSSDIYTCTADAPWTPDKGTPVEHPDAREVEQQNGYPGGDVVRYVCPYCGKTWKEELPQ